MNNQKIPQNSNYDVDALIQNMNQQLSDYMQSRNIQDPLMVGIHTAGVWVARRLHKSLKIQQPLGELNISFYRDDFSRIGLHSQIKPSQIPVSVENKHIILVDDVLYTGRTIRAAMNELFDYGRPASITLAVLIDRGNRELPIQAQVAGMMEQMPPHSYYRITEVNEKLNIDVIHRESKKSP